MTLQAYTLSNMTVDIKLGEHSILKKRLLQKGSQARITKIIKENQIVYF